MLGLVVTDELYRSQPDLPEGQLAKLRASVVNMTSLAGVARRLGDGGIGPQLLLGRGEETTGGREKDSILADAVVDGVDVVELGYLLLGVAERAIVVAQIVDEGDAHQRDFRRSRVPVSANRPLRIGVAIGVALEVLEDQVVALAADT